MAAVHTGLPEKISARYWWDVLDVDGDGTLDDTELAKLFFEVCKRKKDNHGSVFRRFSANFGA